MKLSSQTAHRWTWHASAVVALLLIACALLVKNLGHNFPYLVHADEWQIIVMVNQLLELGYRTYRPDYSPGFVWLLTGEFRLLDAITPGTPLPTANFFFGRYTSALMAMLSLALLYACGKRFRAPTSGLLALVFMLAFTEFVSRAHTIMPDSAATFWGLLALWTALAGMDDQHDRWFAASLLAGLLAFISKFNALPAIGLAPLAVIIKYRSQPRQVLKIGGLVTAGLAVGLLLIHLQIDLIFAFKSHDRTVTFFQKDNPFQLSGAAGNWRSLWQAVGPVTLGIAALLLPAALTYHKGWRASLVGKLVLIAVFCVVFFVALSLFKATEIRDMLLIVCSVALLWGLALVTVLPGRVQWLALVIGVTLLTPGLRESVDYAQRVGRTYTAVLAGQWLLDNAPHGAQIATEEMLFLRRETGYSGPLLYGIGDVNSVLDNSLADYQNWGFDYFVAKLDETRDFYSEDTPLEIVYEISSEGRRGPDLIIFAVPPVQQHPQQVWLGEAQTGDGYTIYPFAFRGYDLPRTELQPGFVLEFTLYWQSVLPVDADYVVRTELVDAGGKVAASEETAPVNVNNADVTWPGGMDFFGELHRFVLPADLAAGSYDLRVSLADATSGEALPATNLDGETLGDSLSLGEITITR